MYFIFDRFELDRERHQLLDCDTDQTLALRPQAFSVLVFLLERAPATVSRDELLKGVWGHTALSSSGVSQAIREIRRTLGDDANDPKILATRHGCGYQLIAPVQIRSDDSESEPAIVDLVSTERERLPETRQRARVSRQSALIAAAVAAAPLVALVASLMLTEPSPRMGRADSDSSSWMLSGRRLPQSADASDAWSMGLAARTLSDRDGALRQFERAWQEAPDSTSVLLALINAKVDVGEIVDARELLQHELLKRARLSHRERLELRATVARVAGSWSVAADALQSLADFFPGERQYALWLFDARMHSTSPQRAAEALSRLMPISDPAVALAMTRLDLRQGRLSDALKHAGTALKLADASDADAAGIAARSRLAGLLFAVSDHSGHLEAERLLAEAINLGERGAAPSALLEARIQRFELALEQNDAAAALSQVDAVCAGTDRVTADRVTNRSECARMQAILALAQGHVAEARVRLEQATEGFEKLAWTERLGELRRLEAELELRLGQVSAARARLAEAEQMHRQIGAATQLARSSMVRGDVLAASLQYPAAIEQYRLGLRHYQDGGDGHAAAHALARLAATLPLIGQYDLAEQARFEAADIFQAIDDERGLVELDRATALTAGRTGELDRATRQLESVDLRYMDLGDNDGRIEALAKLVQMYSQGLELTEAQAALHRALELSTTNPLVRAQLALAAADLAMVESDFGAAAVRIADARATLATEGSSVQMHRVDLAQARLLLESGEAEAAERLGRALLADVLRPNPGVQAVAGTGIAEAIPEEDRLATVMLLVQSLSDQRRIDEARWTLENLAMLDVGRVAADLGLRLQMLQAYLSETTTPIERLREVRDLALGQGFRLLALESDARLASALMRNQRDDEGALLADAVSRQASASGAICVVDYLARLRSPLRR